MWIISNDHSILVKLDGTLKMRSVENIVAVVYEEDTVLGLFNEKSEAVAVITKIAELLESGARENYIYEMPAYPCSNTQNSLPMNVFK